jgi:hypothetical protein
LPGIANQFGGPLIQTKYAEGLGMKKNESVVAFELDQLKGPDFLKRRHLATPGKSFERKIAATIRSPQSRVLSTGTAATATRIGCRQRRDVFFEDIDSANVNSLDDYAFFSLSIVLFIHCRHLLSDWNSWARTQHCVFVARVKLKHCP